MVTVSPLALLFSLFHQFLGLSGQAWQAAKYSAGREGLGGESIAGERKVAGLRN
jgi:hypothetical protein